MTQEFWFRSFVVSSNHIVISDKESLCEYNYLHIRNLDCLPSGCGLPESFVYINSHHPRLTQNWQVFSIHFILISLCSHFFALTHVKWKWFVSNSLSFLSVSIILCNSIFFNFAWSWHYYYHKKEYKFLGIYSSGHLILLIRRTFWD